VNYIKKSHNSPHLQGLDVAQLEAVRQKDAPCVVVAGPGSGKTKVLVARFVDIVRTMADPQKLVSLTFGRRAAGELADRLAISAKISRTRLIKSGMVSTLHSCALRILREHHEAAGLPADFELLDEAAARKLINSQGPAWKAEWGDLAAIISRWQERDLTPHDAQLEGDGRRDKGTAIAAEKYALYDAAKRGKGVLDYGDFCMRAKVIMQNDRNILDTTRNRMRYIMLDEAQDTSPAQIKFLDLISLPDKSNLWMVGDDDQSLYSFRGADPTFLTKFSEKPGTKLIKLEKSWRCPPSTLRAAQSVVQLNAGRIKKTMISDRKEDGAVAFARLGDQQEEARFVADRIAGMIKDGADASHFAVLARTGAYLLPSAFALAARGIGISAPPELSPWKRPEPSLVFSALKWKFGDKDEALAEIEMHHERGHRLLNGLKALPPGGWSSTCRAIGATVAGLMPGNHDRAMDWQEASFSTAEAAVTRGSLQAINDLLTQEENQETSVRLDTIHGSKGLEWPHVTLVGAADGLIPHAKSTSLEEERRLFFVALTRCKETILITWPEKRRSAPIAASPFLKTAVAATGSAVKWQGNLELLPEDALKAILEQPKTIDIGWAERLSGDAWKNSKQSVRQTAVEPQKKAPVTWKF
jgi:DNA helicase-2/ATP-dependent DNA helicase PcrA